MSLLFYDSFDTTGVITDKWTSGSALIQTTTKRSGLAAMALAHFGNGVAVISPATASATMGIGFAAYFPSGAYGGSNNFLYVYDAVSNQHMGLSLNAGGTVSIRNSANTIVATSAAALVASNWYYLEVKLVVANSGGTIEVHLDETLLVSYTGDTQGGATATWSQITVYGTNTVNWFCDDLVVWDGVDATATQGWPNNTFLGDVVVRAALPIADTATADWAKSTGTSGFALIDEVPPSATDYLTSSVIGDRSTFQMTALASVADVYGVMTGIWGHKTDAGTRIVAPTWSALSAHVGTDHALSTSDRTYYQILGLNAETSAAWTCAQVDAARWGVKVTG